MPIIPLKKTSNTRSATYGIANLIGNLVQFSQNQPKCLTFANLGNGTAAGKLRTQAAISYVIKGAIYTKASTDDIWDLSAKPALLAAQYKAHALMILANGNAAIFDGPIAASVEGALSGIVWDDGVGGVTEDEAVVGIYVAGPSTDYSLALVAQGTLYHGWPNSPPFAQVQLI